MFFQAELQLMIILLITSIEAVTYWTPGYYEKRICEIRCFK